MSMYSRFWFYIKTLYGLKTIKSFGQDNKLNQHNLCLDFSTCVPVVMATCWSHHSHAWHCAVQQHNGKLHLTYVHPWIPSMRLFSHSLLVCGCVCRHMIIWFADTIEIIQPVTSWAVEPVVEIKKYLAYGGGRMFWDSCAVMINRPRMKSATLQVFWRVHWVKDFIFIQPPGAS